VTLTAIISAMWLIVLKKRIYINVVVFFLDFVPEYKFRKLASLKSY